MEGFLLIAHRGDSDNAPENTLPAFDLALDQGFTHFETDCQLSADGTVIILHDEKLGRTNNGSGCAWDLSLQQLQQLDAGSWFNPEYAGSRIPTLSQLLERYSHTAHIHLELKSQQLQLPMLVAREVTAAGLHLGPQGNPHTAVPGLTITSFHLQQLVASKQLLPHVPHAWLIQEVQPQLLEQAAAAGLQGVCPRANALQPEGVAAIKALGLYVRVWGVKSLELLHHVVACGAQGATVNWPVAARDALAAAGIQWAGCGPLQPEAGAI